MLLEDPGLQILKTYFPVGYPKAFTFKFPKLLKIETICQPKKVKEYPLCPAGQLSVLRGSILHFRLSQIPPPCNDQLTASLNLIASCNHTTFNRQRTKHHWLAAHTMTITNNGLAHHLARGYFEFTYTFTGRDQPGQFLPIA